MLVLFIVRLFDNTPSPPLHSSHFLDSWASSFLYTKPGVNLQRAHYGYDMLRLLHCCFTCRGECMRNLWNNAQLCRAVCNFQRDSATRLRTAMRMQHAQLLGQRLEARTADDNKKESERCMLGLC